VSVKEILSMTSFIYSDIVEIIFCFLYAYILVRISTAKSTEFRSAFYKFAIATGIAAISNVLLNFGMRLINGRFPFIPNRGMEKFYYDSKYCHPSGLICTLNTWLSHICALSISLGKTLSVSTRYTAICLAHRKDVSESDHFIYFRNFQFWEGRKVLACLVAMLGIPFILYSYVPFLPAVIVPSPDGYGEYRGIAEPGFMVAKVFAACGYFFFFFSTIPM
ncbi:hypothetical protein PMAYCL1PPCAC_27699, partial [Pristionchus mayeri]